MINSCVLRVRKIMIAETVDHFFSTDNNHNMPWESEFHSFRRIFITVHKWTKIILENYLFPAAMSSTNLQRPCDNILIKNGLYSVGPTFDILGYSLYVTFRSYEAHITISLYELYGSYIQVFFTTSHLGFMNPMSWYLDIVFTYRPTTFDVFSYVTFKTYEVHITMSSYDLRKS